MKKIRYIFCIIISLLMLTAAMIFLAGCGSSSEIDTTGMYLVIYDGNGGYLGNKAAQVRKLFCYPGSKIPDYPVDYTDNQYTVPSLGLAMREGYNLLGWYYAADYSESEYGEYIRLSLEDGNGVYEDRADGKYVRNYIKSDAGTYIFIYVESADDEEGTPTYIYIDAAEYSDEEGNAIGIESGFYICKETKNIEGKTVIDTSDIDDDMIRSAYEAAYKERKYTKSQVDSLAGWHLIDELADNYKTLFAGLDKYVYTFVEATENDEALDHYELISDYASVYSIFIEDENGPYVLTSDGYELMNGDDDHDSGERYSINDKYVFTSESTASMTRYDAMMKYWNFANDTVEAEDCEWDGEKYVITLYAHWEKKNTVYYHYENGTGQIDESNRRLLSDNITYLSLTPGDIIGKKEIVPAYVGHTFVCWSKTPGEYDPWDFANDVFPEGTSELHLYAYYLEGTYKRITSSGMLTEVGKNPSGKFILATDLDLGGAEYSSSPLGLTSATVFTGEFLGFDHKISNYTIKLTPNKSQIDSGEALVAALFPNTCGATIDRLNVEATVSVSGLTSKGDDFEMRKDVRIDCAALVGHALSESGEVSGTTVISDCTAKLTVKPRTSSALVSTAYRYVFNIGDFVATEGDYEISNSASSVDITALTGNVSVKTNVSDGGTLEK